MAREPDRPVMAARADPDCSPSGRASFVMHVVEGGSWAAYCSGVLLAPATARLATSVPVSLRCGRSGCQAQYEKAED